MRKGRCTSGCVVQPCSSSSCVLGDVRGRGRFTRRRRGWAAGFLWTVIWACRASMAPSHHSVCPLFVKLQAMQREPRYQIPCFCSSVLCLSTLWRVYEEGRMLDIPSPGQVWKHVSQARVQAAQPCARYLCLVCTCISTWLACQHPALHFETFWWV